MLGFTRQPLGLPGATTSWGMAGVAMSSLISVLIAWHALAVTSMFLKIQTMGSGFKPETICSKCFRKFP
jgi:hypothetical protein